MSEDNPTPDEAPPAAPPAPDAPAEGGLVIEVDTSDTPAARIAALEAQVAKLAQEKKDLWEKFVRSAADLENYRKRTKRDLDDAKADSRTRVLKEMLPVADNLERAVAHATGDTAAVLEGVRLVLRQFTHAFERCEVHPVDAEGKPFDPNLHEAIGQQESDQAPGTIVSVLQKGYRLGERLLRPSLVVVARPKSAPAPIDAEETAEVPPPGGGAGGEGEEA